MGRQVIWCLYMICHRGARPREKNDLSAIKQRPEREYNIDQGSNRLKGTIRRIIIIYPQVQLGSGISGALWV